MAWTFHLFEAIKTNIDQAPIHEHHGESVGKSLISLKPWAKSLAFVFRGIFSIFNFAAFYLQFVFLFAIHFLLLPAF